MMKGIITVMVILLWSSIGAHTQTPLQPVTYSVDFGIKNLGVTVHGSFKGFQGKISFSPDNLTTSKLQASVDVNTISTGNNTRDNHLKQAEYFDAANYPTIQLTSSNLYKKGGDYAGMFNLTIKGTSKQLEIPFTYTDKGDEVSFEANFTIDRRDYGVGGFSIIMSDDVDVHILVNAKK